MELLEKLKYKGTLAFFIWSNAALCAVLGAYVVLLLMAAITSNQSTCCPMHG